MLSPYSKRQIAERNFRFLAKRDPRPSEVIHMHNLIAMSLDVEIEQAPDLEIVALAVKLAGADLQLTRVLSSTVIS